MPKREGSEALSPPIYVQFPPEIDRKIRDLASTDERSLSWVVRKIVTDALVEPRPRGVKRTAAA